MLRCTPAQSMQMNTPKLHEHQLGLRAPQSKHDWYTKGRATMERKHRKVVGQQCESAKAKGKSQQNASRMGCTLCTHSRAAWKSRESTRRNTRELFAQTLFSSLMRSLRMRSCASAFGTILLIFERGGCAEEKPRDEQAGERRAMPE
jgi:hypothetical protein